MRYKEFLRQLGKAGLSIREFAQLVRMNRNSVSNYARTGGVPGHLAVIATLMGEMREGGLDFKPALDRIDINRKKPRGGAKGGRFGGERRRQTAVRP